MNGNRVSKRNNSAEYALINCLYLMVIIHGMWWESNVFVNEGHGFIHVQALKIFQCEHLDAVWKSI